MQMFLWLLENHQNHKAILYWAGDWETETYGRIADEVKSVSSTL